MYSQKKIQLWIHHWKIGTSQKDEEKACWQNCISLILYYVKFCCILLCSSQKSNSWSTSGKLERHRKTKTKLVDQIKFFMKFYNFKFQFWCILCIINMVLILYYVKFSCILLCSPEKSSYGSTTGRWGRHRRMKTRLGGKRITNS